MEVDVRFFVRTIGCFSAHHILFQSVPSVFLAVQYCASTRGFCHAIHGADPASVKFYPFFGNDGRKSSEFYRELSQSFCFLDQLPSFKSLVWSVCLGVADFYFDDIVIGGYSACLL